MKRKRQESIPLTNPWSGSTTKTMTWLEIRQWCRDNIHPRDRRNWLNHARRAYDRGDSDTLGVLIIGS